MRYVSSRISIAAAGAAFAFAEDEPRLTAGRTAGRARWIRVLLVLGLVVA
jgi:hypothetical protein